MNRQSGSFVSILLGGVLGVSIALAAMPDGVAALSASVRDGTVIWLLARVGGFVAYGLLWLSVVFGLLLTGKVARAWPGVRQAAAVHRVVSVLALVYSVGHALVLLADHTFAFDLWSILVPFGAAAYRPTALGLGQVGLYLLLIVLLSNVVRRRIGGKAWRVLHYATFVLYYLVTAHGLLAGSDSHETWALAIYISTGVITYALTVYRVLVASRPVLKETQSYVIGTISSHDSAGGG